MTVQMPTELAEPILMELPEPLTAEYITHTRALQKAILKNVETSKRILLMLCFVLYVSAELYLFFTFDKVTVLQMSAMIIISACFGGLIGLTINFLINDSMTTGPVGYSILCFLVLFYYLCFFMHSHIL